MVIYIVFSMMPIYDVFDGINLLIVFALMVDCFLMSFTVRSCLIYFNMRES